MNGREDKIKSN